MAVVLRSALEDYVESVVAAETEMGTPNRGAEGARGGGAVVCGGDARPSRRYGSLRSRPLPGDGDAGPGRPPGLGPGRRTEHVGPGAPDREWCGGLGRVPRRVWRAHRRPGGGLRRGGHRGRRRRRPGLPARAMAGLDPRISPRPGRQPGALERGMRRPRPYGWTPSGSSGAREATWCSVASGDAAVGGEAFARALDRLVGHGQLRSARFEVQRSGGSLRLVGSGTGHGVGLCQAGAARRAGEGQGYEQILRHDFPHARIDGQGSNLTPGSAGPPAPRWAPLSRTSSR